MHTLGHLLSTVPQFTLFQPHRVAGDLGNQWFHLQQPINFLVLSIAVQELIPAVLATALFSISGKALFGCQWYGPLWLSVVGPSLAVSGKAIFGCQWQGPLWLSLLRPSLDNMSSVVHVFNSRNLCILVFLAAWFNFRLQAQHEERNPTALLMHNITYSSPSINTHHPND